jgi:mannitol-1-phosphate 5-dehydrogenase
MKAVHFGAGNIGRGFIGLLLAQAGLDLCFVDVNAELVQRIRERGAYTVRLLGQETTTERVEGVTALDGRDLEAVAQAIAEADLVTTSVGPGALVHIAPAIAAGLRLRGPKPLNIIACENMVGASSALREHVQAAAGGVALTAAFPNAVVDRIVPNYKPEAGEDPLTIAVEPYHEWLVDRSAVVEPMPHVAGMGLVANLPAYTERKLFGLNMGHAIVAYLGYLQGHTYIHEAVADPLIRSTLMTALVEAGLALVHRHGFTEAEQAAYASKMLQRFANPALGDPVVRVGRDPLRKLGPADRLVAPAKLAIEAGLLPRGLARGIAAGLLFNPSADPAAVALAQRVQTEGLEPVITSVTGLPADSVLFRLIREEYALLQDLVNSKG